MMMKARTRGKDAQDSIRTPANSQFEPHPFATPKPEPEALGREARFGHSFGEIGLFPIQPKLVVGPADDKYEQEADRVAEQVMRMPDPQAVSSGTFSIQGTCPTCEEDELWRQSIEEEEGLHQTKEISGQISETTPNLESRIGAIRGGGQPLAESERAFFEPRFGCDFSQVCVHTDAKADALNRSLNARAFTTGQDILFQQGGYNPSSSVGRRLLAHELTHVVQQAGKQMQRQTRASRFGLIGRNQYLQMTNGNVMSISGGGEPNTRIGIINTGRSGWGGVSEGVFGGFAEDDSYVRLRVVTTSFGFGRSGAFTLTDAIRGELYVGVRICDFRDNKTFNDEFASDIAVYRYFRIQNGNVVMDPTQRVLLGQVEGGKLTVQSGLINRGQGIYMCVVNVRYQKEPSGGENLTLTAGPVQSQWGTITGNREIMRGYVGPDIVVRQP